MLVTLRTKRVKGGEIGVETALLLAARSRSQSVRDLYLLGRERLRVRDLT